MRTPLNHRGRWRPARWGRYECRECGRTVALTKDALMYPHGPYGRRCASGGLPLAAAAR